MRPPPRLLQRETELRVLKGAVAGAARGDGALVVVEGPPGIGKTSLLQAAVADIEAPVFSAVGGPLERAIPYGLVRQLLERSARRDGIPDSAAAAACAFGLQGPPAVDDGAVLYGLFWLLSERATDEPVVLVVDDAHWGDDPSLRWLTFVARRIRELPVAMLLARRRDEPGTDTASLDGLGALADQIVILPPLSTESCERMVGRVLGRRSEPGLGASCQAATGGNPFLLHEVFAAARAEGADSEALLRVLELGPPQLGRAVLLRLARLPGTAFEVAKAVSVLGDATPSRHVAELTGIELDVVEHAADTLAAADVLRRERPLSFVHPVVRAAIEADIDPGARAALHARSARILLEQGSDLEHAAAHLMATPGAGDPWVVDVLRDAARAAGARGAYDTAAALLRRALDEPPQLDDRPAVLLELGAAETRIGDPEGRSRLYQAYRSTSDVGIRLGAVTQLHRSSILPADEGRAQLELLADQLQHAPPGSATERAAVAGLIASARVSGLRLSESAFDRAEALRSAPGELADQTPDDRFILSVLALDALAANQPAERVLSLAGRALGDLDAYTAAAHAGYPLHYALTVLIFSDRARDALGRYAAAADAARRRGSHVALTFAVSGRAAAHLQLGALASAEADASAGIGLLADFPLSQAELLATATLARVRLRAGDTTGARRALDGVERPPTEVASTYDAFLGCARAEIALVERRHMEARKLAFSAGERADSADFLHPAVIPWRPTAALACMHLNASSQAAELADAQLAAARDSRVPSALGAALRLAAAVQPGDAVELLTDAVAALDDSEARYERALTLIELGAALRRQGERQAAREPLRAGLDLAYQCGAAPLVERATVELRAAGARPRRVMRTGVDALTASEHRVAALAAEGLTNAEIARELFVTPKTVEAHLAHSFRKLDLTSRKQLAAALAPAAK
jgi:DNA-binding CsgD family transcriptional regulator